MYVKHKLVESYWKTQYGIGKVQSDLETVDKASRPWMCQRKFLWQHFKWNVLFLRSVYKHVVGQVLNVEPKLARVTFLSFVGSNLNDIAKY